MSNKLARGFPTLFVLLGTTLIQPSPVAGPLLSVVAVEPAPHALDASVDTRIVVRFDRPVAPLSVTDDSFWAFGKWSGTVEGSYSFADGGRVVTLTPDRRLSAGESVMVFLSHDIAGVDGSSLRDAGYSFRFWTSARTALAEFIEIDRFTTRSSPGVSTQAYGGIASDLNRDGYLDITIVNEISADLRVFLNEADGSGLFNPFFEPTFPVAARASPSEPADFNHDGFVDICVANIDDDSVSILMGSPSGRFRPQQKVDVGLSPRGIAALDFDGDGDVDIVNTNSGSGEPSMSLLLNDGSGVFGTPIFFNAGISAPWALAAADMSGNGVMNLVVGSRLGQQIVVMERTRAGTYQPLSFQDAGGGVWMLVTGDVDGDGAEDVATINSFTNNAAILLGDGSGNLAPPEIYTADPFGLATDLGDLDGDGDLDWVTSSFNGDWLLYMNDGQGGFAFGQQFGATIASSCALLFDIDNDRDLDLGLIDEIADEVIVMQNSGIASPAFPPGVSGGDGGSVPLTVTKLDENGVTLSLSWDSSTCDGAVDHHLIFGGGAALSAARTETLQPDGGRCAIGSRSPFRWLSSADPASDPGGLIWFLLLANDGEGVEGSWGAGPGDAERVGPGAHGSSAQCGMTDKDLVNECGG